MIVIDQNPRMGERRRHILKGVGCEDHGSPSFRCVALAVVTTAGIGMRPGAVVVATQREYQESGRMERHDDLLVRANDRCPASAACRRPRRAVGCYLLDTSQLGAARAAIEAVFGMGWVPAAGVRAIQGQYVVSQLKAWSEMATAILELPGVTAVDLDEARNRVAIGIEEQVQDAGSGTGALGDRDPATRGYDPGDGENSSASFAACFTRPPGV